MDVKSCQKYKEIKKLLPSVNVFLTVMGLLIGFDIRQKILFFIENFLYLSILRAS